MKEQTPQWSAPGVQDDLERAIARLIQAAGDDPNREGLKETPARVLKAYQNFWASGYGQDPKALLKTFADGAGKRDQMVKQLGVPVWSLCEHHFAPFFGVCHIAYVPNDRIVGLSKLSRVVDVFARRFQVQERLTDQVADLLAEGLEPKGVAVEFQCRHTCMESRGVCRAGITTITTALRGVFRSDDENGTRTRQEFQAAIAGYKGVL